VSRRRTRDLSVAEQIERNLDSAIRNVKIAVALSPVAVALAITRLVLVLIRRPHLLALIHRR
jgi:hypothetical protein